MLDHEYKNELFRHSLDNGGRVVANKQTPSFDYPCPVIFLKFKSREKKQHSLFIPRFVLPDKFKLKDSFKNKNPKDLLLMKMQLF